MAQNQPDVSVIIPMYNESKYIGRCLASLKAQTYPLDRIEFIIVDGASTDDSAATVEAMAADFPNLQLIRNTVRWTPQSLNLAIRQSSGDIIVRIDSHCQYSPDYIERCIEVQRRTGAGCVGGLLNAASSISGLIPQAICLAQESGFGTGGSRWRSGGQAGYIDTVPFGCFPRWIFQQVGFYDIRLPRNQDNEFSSRIRAFGHRVYFDPAISATYYTRSTLGSYCRMLWLNGLYHCLVWRVNPRSFTFRHLVPMFFTLGLLIAMFCALAVVLGLTVLMPVLYLAVLGFTVYGLLNVLFSAKIALRHGVALIFIMPWLFMLTHIVYGAGTLAGLLKFGLKPLPDNPEVKQPSSQTGAHRT